MPDVTTPAQDIATRPESVAWNSSDIPGSLNAIKSYVESEANKAADWYYRAKRSKAAWSRFLRAAAILLSTAAGILPIAVTLKWGADGRSGLWVSLLLGLAAGAVGLDHFFGFSSGWIRYVITASGIQNALEEFRMDWSLLYAHLSTPPTAEQLQALIERAKSFRVAVAGMVLDETKAWAAEFQSNMAQLEKDVKASFEQERQKAEQDLKARTTAVRPGAIELKVVNAETVDNGEFNVSLEGSSTPAISEKLEGSNCWSKTAVAPGQYRVVVWAARAGKRVQASKIIRVEADAVADAEVELPAG